MSRVIFNLVFTLLLGIHLEAANVEPPTNVTFDCHNLVQVVKWSYTEFIPDLRFRIHVGTIYSSTQDIFVDSPNLQADFSLDTDPADTYMLLVSAVVRQNVSDEMPPDGIHFTYNKNSAASKTCFMDLPAVNVTVMQDGFARFSFTHPWLLYGDKIPVKKSTKKKRHSARTEVIPEFNYEVFIVSKGISMKFDCNESECEEEFPVDPQEEKLCLKISGDMEKMAVRGTQEYCTMLATALPAKDDFTYIVYIIVTLLVLIALAFILFLVYQKLTRPSSSLPAAMTFKDHLCRAVGVVRDQVSVPEVEPASPTPLLPSTEFPPITSSTEPEFRERIGVLTEDEGVCDDGEKENDEVSGYTQGGNLDEDEEEIKVEPSYGYESRPVVD